MRSLLQVTVWNINVVSVKQTVLRGQQSDGGAAGAAGAAGGSDITTGCDVGLL